MTPGLCSLEGGFVSFLGLRKSLQGLIFLLGDSRVPSPTFGAGMVTIDRGSSVHYGLMFRWKTRQDPVTGIYTIEDPLRINDDVSLGR